MDLTVQITKQGMILTWPGGQMVLTNIDRVHLSTPHTAVTLNADGTNWPAQSARGQLRRPGRQETPRSKRSEHAVQTADDHAENLFDPMHPEADLADCIAYFLTQPQVVLPASLDEIQNLLQTRTAFGAAMIGHPNLERTMGSDMRFRKLPGNDWTLTVAWPPSDNPDSALSADAHSPLPIPPNPTALELFQQEFNPRIPGGKVADYVYYLMTQPDETLPMLMTRILSLLMSRTAVDMSKETTPGIRRQLLGDPRFRKVDGRSWDLSLAHRRNSLQPKSVIDYIYELVEQPHVKLPISLTMLTRLLERHTDIGRPRCDPDTLHAAMIRDPRFYRTAPETWQVKLTPRVPEDTPAENT